MSFVEFCWIVILTELALLLFALMVGRK